MIIFMAQLQLQLPERCSLVDLISRGLIVLLAAALASGASMARLHCQSAEQHTMLAGLHKELAASSAAGNLW
jgi:hypothetical protein